MSNKVKLGIGVAVVAIVAILFGTQSELFKGVLRRAPRNVLLNVTQNPALPSGPLLQGFGQTVTSYDITLLAGAPRTKLTTLRIRFAQSDIGRNGNTVLKNVNLTNSASMVLGTYTGTAKQNTLLTFNVTAKNIWLNAGDTYRVNVIADIMGTSTVAPAPVVLVPSIPAITGVRGITLTTPRYIVGPRNVVNLTPVQLLLPAPTPVFTVSPNASVGDQTHFAGTANALLGSFVITASAGSGATVTSMAVKLGGVFPSGGVTNLKLKKVNSTGGLTQLGGVIAAPSVDTSLNFSISPGLVFSAGANVINVYGDLSSSLAAGSTISLSLPPNAVSGFDTATSTAFSAPSSALALQTMTTGSPSLVVLKDYSSSASGEISPAREQLIARLSITAASDMKLKDLIFTGAGTITPIPLSNVKLWKSVGGGTPTQLGSAANPDASNKISFRNLNFDLVKDAPVVIEVKADVLRLPGSDRYHSFELILNSSDVIAIDKASGQLINGSGPAWPIHIGPFQVVAAVVPPPPPTTSTGTLNVASDYAGSITVTPGLAEKKVASLKLEVGAAEDIKISSLKLWALGNLQFGPVRLLAPSLGGIQIGSTAIPAADGEIMFSGITNLFIPRGTTIVLDVNAGIAPMSCLPPKTAQFLIRDSGVTGFGLGSGETIQAPASNVNLQTVICN